MDTVRYFDGAKLKRLRLRKNLSQTDLVFEAARTGFKISTVIVSRQESGHTQPKAHQLAFYAKFFGIKQEAFMKRSTTDERNRSSAN